MSGCSLRISTAAAHALVLVGRRHPDVDDREIGVVLGDGGEERLTVADTRDHGMAGVLEQSLRVPRAGGLHPRRSRLAWDRHLHRRAATSRTGDVEGAAVRCDPVPEAGEPRPASDGCAAHSVVRDAHAQGGVVGEPPGTATFDADPCLTAFVIASHATK